jgi:DNA-binding NtrC family response regulator
MSALSPIRVLIVDDEPAIRASLEAYLVDCDFAVSSAGTAEQAVARAAEHAPRVAIVDVRIPGTGVEELIEKLHELSPGIRFLIYTGSADYRVPPELERFGIEPGHVFIKPGRSLDPMVEAIRKLAGG